MEPESKAFIGSWRAVSCEHLHENGSVEHPFGEKPQGRIVYTADQRMIVVLVDPARTKFPNDQFFEAGDQELAAAARGCIAYTGTWAVHGDQVVHAIEASLFPNWIGTKLARFFKFEGNRMTLSTGGFKIGGAGYTATLVWEKE